MPPEDEPKTAALSSRSAIVAALLLLGAIIVMVVVTQGCTSDNGPVRVGDRAPDIQLTTLEGEEMALSDFEGRPVMVNFWASWCPPCREEFPVLVKAHQAHGEDGFEILGITRNDGEEQSRRFVADSGAGWPILPDRGSVAWDTFGAQGLPTSYFIDADGVVQGMHIGPLSDEQLDSYLEAIGLPAEA